MGRSFNYFFGMLFSRMSIYAYGIGSGFTTGFLYIGFLSDLVYLRSRIGENLPVILDMYLQVAVPIWVPPITKVDGFVFMANLVFGAGVLLYWTAKYESSTRHRGF